MNEKIVRMADKDDYKYRRMIECKSQANWRHIWLQEKELRIMCLWYNLSRSIVDWEDIDLINTSH